MIKRFVYDLLTGPNREHALKHLALLEKRLPSARSRFAVPFVFRGRGHFKTIRPRRQDDSQWSIDQTQKANCPRDRRVTHFASESLLYFLKR